jgi:tetratricopeptide (TPR) repeat protein
MKRNFLTGVLVMAAAVSGLMAQMKPKSPAEADAVRALFAAQTAQNPDATIKAAEDLLTKFADTEYKEVTLLLEADAYQHKGDYASAEITDERILETYPKNPQAAMQLGELIVQHVHDNDLDKEEQLTKAEKRLNQALENIETKPYTGMPDAAWAENKKYTKAEVQNDLGLVAMQRKKFDVAIAEFKLAIEADPQPAYQVRLASSYVQSGKNDEAIAICDKVLADPQLHPTIKSVAEGLKASAVKAKGAGAK